MAVYKNSDGKWIVDIRWPHPKKRVRRVSPIQNKRGAEQFERTLRAALADGTYKKEAPVQATPTLKSFKAEFMQLYGDINWRASTRYTYQKMLERHVLPELGELDLADISPRRIARYVAYLTAEGYKEKTINHHLTLIRVMLRCAHEWGHLDELPAVKLKKVPKPAIRFLGFEEASALVEHADGVWHPMTTLALRTGARLGELRELRWSDINWRRRQLTIARSIWRGSIGPPKGKRVRTIDLSEDALEALPEHRHIKGELIFSDELGAHITSKVCRTNLHRISNDAGLGAVGWHMLRHTCASHLAMLGVPLGAIQTILGHTTIEMTMRYAHLAPKVQADAVSLLDRAARGQHLGSCSLQAPTKG